MPEHAVLKLAVDTDVVETSDCVTHVTTLLIAQTNNILTIMEQSSLLKALLIV